MYVRTRNITSGFVIMLQELQAGQRGYAGDPRVVESDTRNGKVLRFDEPMTFTFTSPTERVLLNPSRDSNPFSLLYESLWTLAGRNDVGPISYYTKKMSDYSDDGSTWHGAYGHRWRHHFNQSDQLEQSIRLLKSNPDSRRVVLSMWDTTNDLIEQKSEGKDYPCNTHIYLKIRNGKLNIHVCNRSNDAIWGLFAANYTVFSFLLEYLATKVGVEVGEYHHTSDDLHVYTQNNSGFKAEEWLAADRTEYHKPSSGYTTVPLVKDPEAFDNQLPKIVDFYDGSYADGSLSSTEITEPFLWEVARPMLGAFGVYKKYGAVESEYLNYLLGQIADDAWRVAATEWIARRIAKKEKK